MKSTAHAPSNIAFIKYWGKADDDLRLPLNSSISMNLDNTYTTTTVSFSPAFKKDDISILDGTFTLDEVARIRLGLDRMRKRAGLNLFAKVVTKNTFPKGTGAAASASGFAALTVAGFSALGLTLSEKEYTIFARMGSGSACRSIPDGFVIWEKGNSTDTSRAYSLYPYTYWDLNDLLVIVDTTMKKVSTTEGQEKVMTSPFWQERVRAIPEKIERVKAALSEKNFQKLGEIIEKDCLSMHHIMQTQIPPLIYWNTMTIKLMEAVKRWRAEGIQVYFTIDAGPNVHLICEKPTVDTLKMKLAEMKDIKTLIVNSPAPGTHLIDHHLF